ncbi:MAG TPA: ABC transporter ATP-binding protein [Kofleriaceae bacterium]|nr:ABC transporter ATP-binding protein [Kofleriaceae bacterium]
MAIELRGIRKVFDGGTVALDSLDLRFERGEFLVLLGPSGCGKSTACRILAGLEEPSSGAILMDGTDITQRPPRERDMSMVFQNYALYPHKTVYENIAYPLKVRRRAKGDINREVREVAEMLSLTRLLDRRPAHLSGGEAQRVAVARALVWKPAICLMDEPLSNLDALLRIQTRGQLKRIHRDLKTTFVFVTHDQEEAMSLGTTIVVLERGRLIQLGPPGDIYHRPKSRFVAEFIGRPAMNTVAGRIEGGVFRAGELTVPLGEGHGRADGPVVLGIRPEDIGVADGADGAGSGDAAVVEMTLDVIEAIEPDTLLVLVCGGGVSLTARVLRRSPSLKPGDKVAVSLPRASLRFFDPETGKLL